MRLFGEWLVDHTIKTYKDDAWNHFYVFDVKDENDQYIPYDTYKEMLEEFNIYYIPVLARLSNPNYEDLVKLLDKNTFLIDPEKGSVGEGIVIKNYNYVNKYGRQTWAKLVRQEFKNKHSNKHYAQSTDTIEEKIVNKYITEYLIDKEKAKIDNEEGWNSKKIPKLLGVVFNCLVTEEMWNIVKDFKKPTINFKTLEYLTTQKIKELKPEIFS